MIILISSKITNENPLYIYSSAIGVITNKFSICVPFLCSSSIAEDAQIKYLVNNFKKNILISIPGISASQFFVCQV